MFEIEQYVDSAFCLDCKRCCRFEDKEWLPHLLEDEKRQSGVASVKAKKTDDNYICQFLNLENTTCGIYSQRPFECRLYPFLLVRRGNTLDLAAHLGCPFVMRTINQADFKKYAAYITGFLQKPHVLKMLRAEYEKFRVYPDIELHIVARDILADNRDKKC